jgi:DNA-binding LacI/PurR family transcriptional regulator
MNAPTEGEPPQRGGAGSGNTRLPRQFSDLQKTITMAQIAKAAGVSQGAISSLLNDRDYGIRVSEKTRERVFKVCREMGYIPNDLRALVRMYPELGDFCLLVSSRIEGGLRDPFVNRLAAAAMSAVPDPSHPLSFAFYDEDFDYAKPNSLPHPVRSGTVSKFLLHGPPNPSLIEALTRRGFPVISIGYDIPLPGVTSLVPDYAAASRLAIQHLSKLGHQHLGIISGPFGTTHPRIMELNRGVSVACEEFGLAIEAQTIVYGDLSHNAGDAAIEEFLTRRPVPTAVFAMSDTAALAVLCRAHAHRLEVPKELSVVGCSDDFPAAAGFPQLTTIHLPVEEMAESGIREIEHLVRDGAPDAPRKTVLPVRLVTRNSTAARKHAESLKNF